MRPVGHVFAPTLLILALAPALSAQDRAIVMLDAGHGGDQAGVTAGDVLEKDMVLRASFVLAEEFVSRGYDVRLIRTGDYGVDINERRAMAERAEAAIMISLHFNGGDDPTAHGIEIYANLDDANAARAARSIGAALAATGGPVVVEARPWGFLASPTVATVMIEAGFLTHPVERRLILSRAHHRDLARMIADGAIAFIEGHP